jgi:NAD-dependent dihydropyrimidine dehydrogenase PreA subunit
MPYVITAGCIDKLDGSCTKVCPVDCIYLGDRSRYINPDECIDCGACEPICPLQAIFLDADVPEDQQAYIEDNAAFFTSVLPGRSAPLGKPRGAKKLGTVGVDTLLVAGHPSQR